MFELLVTHRETIIARATSRVMARTNGQDADLELKNGIPVFLDQLGDALRLAQRSSAVEHGSIGMTAERHGSDLLRMGLTIGQVVHDYGDVCQAITELAVEQKWAISTQDFRTLNLCLDDAIAAAVTEYTRQRENTITAEGTERLGVFAHELRNLLTTAMLSFDILKSGRIAIGGSTGVVHGRTLLAIRDLIDRSLATVRLDAGIGHLERLSVAEVVDEIAIGAALQAQARSLTFHVSTVDRTVMIEADRQILGAAISNLLHNAFKFTRERGSVTLTATATSDRVLFEIEDECGGLPPGKAGDLFHAYEQRGTDRSGVGLGLSICLKAARALGGELRVRDVPGHGCVFTLDLPRKLPPPLTVVEGGKSGAHAGNGHDGSGAALGSRPGSRSR